MTDNQPSRLGDLIEKMVASLGQSGRFYGWRMVAEWPQIVGPEIAKISRAVRFSEGVLTVVVEKDVWRQELEMQLDEILTRIWSRPGGKAVQKVVLRAG
jgi:predicted nucleic acid-binding Zn ribbon protein